MKKLLLIFCIMLLSGCGKNAITNDTNITIKKEKIEYGENINLYDLVELKYGKIITEDYKITTEVLEKKEIEIEYLDNKKDKQIYKFNIDIVDTTPPIILASKTYTIEVGDNKDIVSSIFFADNYDRDLKCVIEGNYDINSIGEYNLKFVATDINNNKTEKDFRLIVKKEINYEYDNSSYYLEDLINKYKEDNTMIGIDVSTWQGNINWNSVKNAGVEFAFIRIGYGYNDAGENVLDNKFINNIKNAKAAEIPIGLYFYSYAINEEEAIDQANWVIDTLNKEKLELPIAFDWEDWSEFDNYDLNLIDINNIAKAFIKTIENASYKGMIYGSANYLNSVWNLKEYPTWLAHYTDKTDYDKDYYVWQLANNGIVDGIDGYVDLNILYKK